MTGFPNIDSSVKSDFEEAGLLTALEHTIEDVSHLINNINNSRTFILHRDVVDVLKNIEYDPGDEVYVLSRMDQARNFWTQHRVEDYINHLENIAQRHDGFINQKRVRISPSYFQGEFQDHGIRSNLSALHRPGTYYGYDYKLFRDSDKYRELEKMTYGFTASKKHSYAIMPVPSPAIGGDDRPPVNDVGNFVKHYTEYGIDEGMGAFITIDREYVDKLIEQMDILLDDPNLTKFK